MYEGCIFLYEIYRLYLRKVYLCGCECYYEKYGACFSGVGAADGGMVMEPFLPLG